MFGLPINLNWWVVPPLISFVTFFALAALAIVKGGRHRVNHLFAGICFLGSLLSVDKAFSAVLTDPNLALRISRLDHLVFVFIIPVYLHFTYTFLGLTERKWLLGLAYTFSACLSLFSHQDYYLSSVREYFFGYYAKGGPLMFVFGAASTINIFYCLYLLFRSLRQEKDPERRNKTKYIILGLGVAALMAHVNLLPLAGIGFYPLGNLVFIPIIFLGFAVLKHDLLDLGIVLQRGLIYSLLTGLLSGFFALGIVLFDHFFKGMGHGESLVFSAVFFLAIVFVFEPLKKRVQRIIERIFFKGKYDYQKTLAALSETMASMLDLNEIMEKILRALTEVMFLDWGCVMLMDDTQPAYRVCSHRGKAESNGPALFIHKSSPLIREMERRKQVASKRNVAVWARCCVRPALLRKDFSRLGGTLAVPMAFKGQLNGILVLGGKKSGDLFTPEDLELLRILANQCAISIENARAYSLVERMNQDLEKRVEERTKELRRALSEKEKAQEYLIRSESLAAVGALAAGVAHELNNPIATVSSLVQSAVESLQETGAERILFSCGKTNKPNELVEDLKFSVKELGRAGDIVTSLLGISRQTDEYTEPVALNDASQDALKILFNEYKRTSIEIVETYEERLPETRGNFANLGQVCLNIISNAIQAVDPNEGRIVIRTRHEPLNATVSFECQDNGPGIPREVMRDIFKPFFTTKDVGKGTGLGLYISHEIVRRHDGSITAKNNPQGGALFRVELPVR